MCFRNTAAMVLLGDIRTDYGYFAVSNNNRRAILGYFAAGDGIEIARIYAMLRQEAVQREGRFSTVKQTPFKAIREGLRTAARLERQKRGAEIRMLARLRDSRCPEMWQLYERYCETD